MIRQTHVDEFLRIWKDASDTTLELFEHITDESLTTKAHEHGRTIGRTAWHLAQTIPEMPGKTGLVIEGPGEEDPVPSTAQEICAAYATAAASLYEQVEANWTPMRRSRSKMRCTASPGSAVTPSWRPSITTSTTAVSSPF